MNVVMNETKGVPEGIKMKKLEVKGTGGVEMKKTKMKGTGL